MIFSFRWRERGGGSGRELEDVFGPGFFFHSRCGPRHFSRAKFSPWNFFPKKIPQPPPLPHKNQMVALLLSPTEKDAMEMGKASAGGGFNHAGIGGVGGASSPGTSGSGSGGDGCTAPMCFGGGQTLGRCMLHQENMSM